MSRPGPAPVFRTVEHDVELPPRQFLRAIAREPERDDSKMNDMAAKLFAGIMTRMMREDGQDLVEYALVVALVAFGAITAMGTLANDIGTAFTNVGTVLTSAA
jgi:pilus assembly protein Flp/PilA